MLSKGRKAFPVGTIRKFGGVDHIKTESGKWKRVKQGRKKKAKKKRAKPKTAPQPKVEVTEEVVIGTHVFRAFEKAILSKKIKIAEAMQKAFDAFVKENPDTVLSTGRTAKKEFEALSKELEKLKKEPEDPKGMPVVEPRPPLEGTPQEMASKLVKDWEKAIKEGTENEHNDAKNAFDSFAELFPDVVLENGNTLKRQRQLLMYRWRNRVYKQRKKEGTTKKKPTKKKPTKKKPKPEPRPSRQRTLKPKPAKKDPELESGPFRILPREDRTKSGGEDFQRLQSVATKAYRKSKRAIRKKGTLPGQTNPARHLNIPGLPEDPVKYDWVDWMSTFQRSYYRNPTRTLEENESYKLFFDNIPGSNNSAIECMMRYGDANILATRLGYPPIDPREFINTYNFEKSVKEKIEGMPKKKLKEELKSLGFSVKSFRGEPVNIGDMRQFLYEVEIARTNGIAARPMDIGKTLKISFAERINNRDTIGGQYHRNVNRIDLKKVNFATRSYIHELWHNFDLESNGGTQTKAFTKKVYASNANRPITPAALTIAAFSKFLVEHETTKSQASRFKKRGDSRYADYHARPWECIARFGEQLAAYRNMQAVARGESTQSTRLAREYTSYTGASDRYYTNDVFESLVEAWEAMPYSKDIEGMLSKSIFGIFDVLDLLNKSKTNASEVWLAFENYIFNGASDA